MCTYLTEKLAVEGSGKGAAGWFGLTEATVYFDHPQHARPEHTLNIDFLNPGQGASATPPGRSPRRSSRRWPPRRRGLPEATAPRAGAARSVGGACQDCWQEVVT